MTFKFNALLQFKDNATQGLSKAQRGFKNLKNSIQKANESISKIGVGLRGATLATAPIAGGLAYATNEAMNFEAQMSSVQSKMLATKDEMRALNAITKQLGATTEFTAVQAGEAAESLAQAGFTSKQSIAALPAVLNAASAAGVDLKESADVVANQLGAFGLEAKEAARVADALALTTSLTNTDFTSLAEGMKFVGATARTAGLSVEETASSLGILANAGVKGSLAGTALKNALLQLSKPSKKALELFGGKDGMDKALFRMVDGQKRLKPMEEIMSNISIATSKAKNPLEAVKQAAEILGLRGTTALGAFTGQMKKTTLITNKNLDALKLGAKKTGTEIDLQVGKTIPFLLAVRLQIAGAAGTTRKMAKIKLDNLAGAFKLLGSAVTGLNIEIGSLLTKSFKDAVFIASDFLSVMTTGFQLLSANAKETDVLLKGLKDNENQFIHLIPVMKEFASGFVEGFEEIKKTALDVFESIKEFIKPMFGDTQMTAKEIGKIVAKVIAWGAALAPVFAGMLAFGIVVGPILTGISGLFGLIGTAIGALSAPLWAIIGIMYVFRDEFMIIGKAIYNMFQGNFDDILLLGKSLLKGFWDVVVGVGDMIYFALAEPFNKFMSFLSGVGKVIFDVLTLPIRGAFNLINGILSTIVNSTLGAKALEFAGLDVGAIKEDLKFSFDDKMAMAFGTGNKTEIAKDTGNQFAQENQKLQKESLTQNVITQPPSAQQNASAMKNVITPLAPQSQNSNVSVNLNGQFKLKGSDLLLSVSKSKVENSERNGRLLDPITKRRMVQNGASF